ncbi:MAG: hypothetical protein RI935_166 [Candidatus Parcubacteria bacterium]|jgi:hypothetical protein
MTQKTALTILKLGHTTFLTGAAGAGKSYVLREYISYLKKHGIKYAVTASTGIASTHIGGTTIHSWSGIGIKDTLTQFDLDVLEEKQNLYKRWNENQVLIIDEVSMLGATFLDNLNKLAKSMRRNTTSFGGLQVVFCGDFFQLPPIIRGQFGDSDQAVFAFQSNAWREAKPVVCYLTEQHRQEDDILLSLLKAIRSGEIDEEHYEFLQSRNKQTKKEILRLYTHNENVDTLNEKYYEEIDGEEHYYEMTTKGSKHLVESLKNSCLAYESLSLKIGTKVMCVKNAPDKSYVNGSLGVVDSINDEGYPVIVLRNGKRVTIREESWKIEEDGKVKAELNQLPLRYAWAITVHKSQGMTLDEAEIDLSKAFVRGQGYVALSRLMSGDGLYLKGFNQEALLVSDVVKEADDTFRKKSEQAEDAITKYQDAALEAMHNKNLLERGGSIDEVEEDEEETVKVLSHVVTKEMLDKEMTIEEIARTRNITEDTVVSHIEKLIDQGDTVKIEHTLPKKKELDKIVKAFTKVGGDKLTPIFDELKGEVSFTTLKLVRAHRKIITRTTK